MIKTIILLLLTTTFLLGCEYIDYAYLSGNNIVTMQKEFCNNVNGCDPDRISLGDRPPKQFFEDTGIEGQNVQECYRIQDIICERMSKCTEFQITRLNCEDGYCVCE